MTDIYVPNETPVHRKLAIFISMTTSVQDHMACEDSGATALSDSKQELEEPLEEVVGVALAPSCGEQMDCSSDCKTFDPRATFCQEIRLMDGHVIDLEPIDVQLQFLISKADDLKNHIVDGQGRPENEDFGNMVSTFLYTCQPYFSYLESTARSTVPQHSAMSSHVRSKLLDFSQQLCARLEQLVLTYANYNLLSVDESEPDSLSHFYIGQCQIDRMRLAIFRYCQPAPFLVGADTGLYKRMRWNVTRLRDDHQLKTDEEQQRQQAEKEMTVIDTEYYFLCYKDAPEVPSETDRDGEGQGVATGNMVGMWSIGQWVQMHPDPETEDIYDWILCPVPRARYLNLICLGSEEPSTCSATDCLLGLLLSRQTAGSPPPDCT
ncbi:UPF0575 protein C19orf67 homolog [Polymixia lowei]